MRTKKKSRQVALRVTREARLILDLLAAHLTIRRSKRTTLTDVMEEAILEKAAKEGVHLNGRA